MGMVTGLFAQIQANAPCPSVRPPLVRTSRMEASLFSHSGVGNVFETWVPLRVVTHVAFREGSAGV